MADEENPTNSSLSTIQELILRSWEGLKRHILNLFILNIIGLVGYVLLFLLASLLFASAGFSSYLFNSGSQNVFKMVTDALTSPQSILAFLLIVIGSIIIGAYLSIGAILIITAKNKISFREIFTHSIRLLIPLIIPSLLSFFIILGGTFVVILPGLLFACLLMFTTYEVIINNQRGLEALRRSILIVKQNFLSILGRLLILIGIYLLITILINSLQPNTFTVILSYVINTVLGWYGLIYHVNLYQQSAKLVKDQKPANLRWLVIVAVIGWILAALIASTAYQALSSGAFQKLLNQDSINQNNLDLNIEGELNTEIPDLNNIDPQLEEQLDED